MERWLLTVYLVASALAITQAALIVLQTWEHHRFARGRLRHLRYSGQVGRVALVVPCKGSDVGLEKNLRSLFRQDYLDYEVRFVVESSADPAYPVIRRLMAQYPEVSSRIVAAGRAHRCGQKVHNLRVATADLGEEIRYVAFADSDARLRRQWLRALVSRLDRPGIGAATGYRWYVPVRSSLANHLVYSLNSNIAVFLGSRSPTVVWGGSWAIRRDTFESLGLREAWTGTISDDLVASRLLQQAGLRVLFEPACMVASPMDMTLGELFWFVRRQYVMGRFYLPQWWALVVLAITFSNLVFLASVGAAAWCLAQGSAWTWLPGGVCTILYGISMLGGLFRQDLARTYLPRLQGTLRKARHFEIWSGPWVGLLNWIELIGSMLGREITWRGIGYRLAPGGRVEAIFRQDDTPQRARPADAETADPQAVEGPIIYRLPVLQESSLPDSGEQHRRSA